MLLTLSNNLPMHMDRLWGEGGREEGIRGDFQPPSESSFRKQVLGAKSSALHTADTWKAAESSSQGLFGFV